jgi:hypothetical protein
VESGRLGKAKAKSMGELGIFLVLRTEGKLNIGIFLGEKIARG